MLNVFGKEVGAAVKSPKNSAQTSSTSTTLERDDRLIQLSVPFSQNPTTVLNISRACADLLAAGIAPAKLAAIVHDLQKVAIKIRANRESESIAENDGVLTKPKTAYKSRTALKISVLSWNPVAVWKWMANDDSCGICRMAFDACCSDCNIPGDDCPLVWGQCTHCFHLHCIDKWCQTQSQRPQCPMCRQEWKEAVKNVVPKHVQTI